MTCLYISIYSANKGIWRDVLFSCNAEAVLEHKHLCEVSRTPQGANDGRNRCCAFRMPGTHSLFQFVQVWWAAGSGWSTGTSQAAFRVLAIIAASMCLGNVHWESKGIVSGYFHLLNCFLGLASLLTNLRSKFFLLRRFFFLTTILLWELISFTLQHQILWRLLSEWPDTQRESLLQKEKQGIPDFCPGRSICCTGCSENRIFQWKKSKVEDEISTPNKQTSTREWKSAAYVRQEEADLQPRAQCLISNTDLKKERKKERKKKRKRGWMEERKKGRKK